MNDFKLGMTKKKKPPYLILFLNVFSIKKKTRYSNTRKHIFFNPIEILIICFMLIK